VGKKKKSLMGCFDFFSISSMIIKKLFGVIFFFMVKRLLLLELTKLKVVD